MSRGAKAETEYMIRSIESAKDHYEVLRLKSNADAKMSRRPSAIC